jgi:hypothetical protein
MMRTRLRRSQALLVRLGLLLVLVLTQHGALQHAYSHFGLVPDPYAQRDPHVPPALGCDLGVVHAALDGNPPISARVLVVQSALPVAAAYAVTPFHPLSVLCFQSRAPPALT